MKGTTIATPLSGRLASVRSRVACPRASLLSSTRLPPSTHVADLAFASRRAASMTAKPPSMPDAAQTTSLPSFERARAAAAGTQGDSPRTLAAAAPSPGPTRRNVRPLAPVRSQTVTSRPGAAEGASAAIVLFAAPGSTNARVVPALTVAAIRPEPESESFTGAIGRFPAGSWAPEAPAASASSITHSPRRRAVIPDSSAPSAAPPPHDAFEILDNRRRASERAGRHGREHDRPILGGEGGRCREDDCGYEGELQGVSSQVRHLRATCGCLAKNRSIVQGGPSCRCSQVGV